MRTAVAPLVALCCASTVAIVALLDGEHGDAAQAILYLTVAALVLWGARQGGWTPA